MPLSTAGTPEAIIPPNLPVHVAIIMDGNGRWARQRNLPRLWGHRVGARSVREVVDTAGRIGIRYLTLFAFSTENWNRPAPEIDGLMRLLRMTLRREEENLHRNNVRLETIGDVARLSEEARVQLKRTQERLCANTGLCLILALNYGARDEILRASAALAKAGNTGPTEADFSGALDTRNMPDPDLVIRTSGEERMSNFLLWQAAYAELYFTPVLWPDFRRDHFLEAVRAYSGRVRRFGGAEE